MQLDSKTAEVYADYAPKEAAADAESMESTVNLSVRVPASLAARLRYRAGKERMSMSDLIRKLLDERKDDPFTPAQEERITELITERLRLVA